MNGYANLYKLSYSMQNHKKVKCYTIDKIRKGG